jgi:hypothetical protein
MSEILATYSFLPWLRQGIANSIIKGDHDSSVILRSSIPVSLAGKAVKLDGSEMDISIPTKNIELYGPGDIVGIESKAIIKTEPRNWITNFEPNFLASIDFYDEDFPWRYTPARANANRLRPWITLVVLKEDEIEEGAQRRGKSLPYFSIKAGKKARDLFPKPEELWAWAHVHLNQDLSNDAPLNSMNQDAVNSAAEQVILTNPDGAYSRILCPRKLEANVGYHAFLIPSFESGRLAGLDLSFPEDPVTHALNLVATTCAWDAEANMDFPYYYRWYFKTGTAGDFEYLVSIIQPREADKRVGVREMDVLHAESNLPEINTPAELGGILRLGGALQVPLETMREEDLEEVKKFDEWDQNPFPHDFEKAIATRINLTDAYIEGAQNIEDINSDAAIVLENGDKDPDPVVTLPLYGRWHARVSRLLKERNDSELPNIDNWVHRLNLDPRYRVPAGFGTKVIQKRQEEYMQAAWEQVGKITETNETIRFAQVAAEVSGRFYERHILPLPFGKAFSFTAPVQKRIVYKKNLRDGDRMVDKILTVHQWVKESVVPQAAHSGQFISLTAKRSPLMKRFPVDRKVQPERLVHRINEGSLVVVPSKEDPTGAIRIDDGIEALAPKNVPSFFLDVLQKNPWVKYLPLILIAILVIIVLLFFPVAGGFAFLGMAAAGLTWFYKKLSDWSRAIAIGEAIKPENMSPESVDRMPDSPYFVISEPGSNISPSRGSGESMEALAFKKALKDSYRFLPINFPEQKRERLELDDLSKEVVRQINPSKTIPVRTYGRLSIPSRISDQQVNAFSPVLVYPEIDVPMYQPLAGLSSEIFLPNINLIEQNSMTLLENNQKFIEAYMVGVNHEMSRELLWREYPTDQRGTYFRQFWDVSGFLPPQPVADDIKERLRDIPPIHQWPLEPTVSAPEEHMLGEHNFRAQNGDDTQIVLVIRGELLKKYPTAVVYAHKADWGKINGVKTLETERVFLELSDAEKTNPPRTKLKTPLFEAKVEPDIYFFGFDLTATAARGDEDPSSVTDDPGWFFVIKERPGEPRFGLDDNKADRIINWNNLSWQDVGTIEGKCIELNKTFKTSQFPPYSEPVDQENKPTLEDTQAEWGPDSDAAQLAYILYQVPVLVGVHASRMLPKKAT